MSTKQQCYDYEALVERLYYTNPSPEGPRDAVDAWGKMYAAAALRYCINADEALAEGDWESARGSMDHATMALRSSIAYLQKVDGDFAGVLTTTLAEAKSAHDEVKSTTKAEAVERGRFLNPPSERLGRKMDERVFYSV